MTKLGELGARMLSALGTGALWGYTVLLLGLIVWASVLSWYERIGGVPPGDGLGVLWVFYLSGVAGFLGFLFSVASRGRRLRE
jgi:hypothetical protein